MLTKNSALTLKKALDSTKAFAEVLILDTGSSDDTLSIAKEYVNVRILQQDFIGFGPLHNLASTMATHDWILSLDSDELLSENLQRAFTSLTLNKECVYSFPRHNVFQGKHIKWCGWHPDRIIRLYHRKYAAFSEDLVHEKILFGNLKVITLPYPIIHVSYHEISDFLHKMQLYTTLFAKQNKGKKTSSLGKAIGHGLFAFFKSYVLKRGFLGGKEGFVISVYNAECAYYKYLKLLELQK
jgi:glycosyltransferase involved in cell wall biosynthesis